MFVWANTPKTRPFCIEGERYNRFSDAALPATLSLQDNEQYWVSQPSIAGLCNNLFKRSILVSLNNTKLREQLFNLDGSYPKGEVVTSSRRSTDYMTMYSYRLMGNGYCYCYAYFHLDDKFLINLGLCRELSDLEVLTHSSEIVK